MIPLDRPYLNLFFHTECLREIEPNLEEYLKNNMQDIIKEYPKKLDKIRKKW
jgi:hypothetical protein